MAYAEGVGDAPRCARAIQLIEQLPLELVLLPAQTLGELFRGFIWRGVTVVNPFAPPSSPLLENLLQTGNDKV